jgi:hypothetical protein
VDPVEGVLPDPVLLVAWSTGDEATSPETEKALTARAKTLGWLMVIAPLESAVTTRAEKTIIRTPVGSDPFITSKSVV